ncbi:Maf-like protein [Escherichia coli]|uniref:Maf-like protein n=1 Tax=Escherichia coli TaxID=562 RepID=A0A447XQY1_ECOLX|nr:Maf-like protein [Escherichia coli]
MTSLYLASGSPRRQELLAQLGVTFERIVTGIEEQRQPQESAQQYVVRLARGESTGGCHAHGAGSPGAGCGYYRYPEWRSAGRNRATQNMRRRCCANYRARPIR